MEYKKPQSTIIQGNVGIYPLTTADQVILADGTRLEKDGKINVDVANSADSAKLGGKAPEYYIQPRNLLDNSDFRNPVNQRGQTSYTGSIYSIDRWSSFYSGCVVNVNNGYILIENGSINQYVPVPNGVYSAFACNIDGNIIELDISYSTSKDMMNVSIPAGEWLWACMYEGSYTADTLPPYVPKGYAAELAECQRYFRKGVQAVTIGTQHNSGSIFSLSVPKMRIKPTVTLTEISSQGWGNVAASNYALGWNGDLGSSFYANYVSSVSDDAGKTVVVSYEMSADL